MKKLIFIFACLLWAVPSQARIITVDDDETADFNNIQAAIDDSNDGDTIIVADGTYTGPNNREIDFKGKAITVRSQNGPENCIINCQRSGRGFYFHSGETAQSILSGFTVMNGSAAFGGAIACQGSSPTIVSNIIKDNEAFTAIGGEIPGFGGGMLFSSSSAFVANNLITNNRVTGRGGGLFSDQSQLILRNNIITGNAAHGHIVFFSSAGWGGGISCERSTIVITNNTISGNRANGISYPFYLPGEGGAIQCGNSSLYLANTILWYNSPHEIHSSGTTFEVSYSDIASGWAGTGNIAADPCFAEPGHWNNNGTPFDPSDDFWIGGDYHLKSQAGRWNPNSQSWVIDANTSVCIDAGNPGCPVGDEPAPNGNRRNMGAYGGTAEASKSPTYWRSIADLTNDWLVDSNDLKVFVGYWLQTGECIPSDLDRSQSVDFNDFAIFGLQWSYPSAFEPGMTFHVDDCNMDEGLSWPAAAESNEPRFSLWVEGRYIHFEDLMYANCCPEELGLDKEINGNEITLYEIGYGGLCWCMCYFPITATLGPFEDGNYTVEVFDNYGNSLGVVEVTIGGSPEPGMTFQIDDCNTEEGQSWPVAAESNEPRFSLWVEGRYIHFEDQMYANCCPDELGLDKEINGNEITLYEIGYGGMCDCMCYFPITATLGPFEDGTYTVEVYDNYGNSLGVVEVTIGGSPEPGITYQIEDCNRDASNVFAAEPPDKTRFKVTVEGSYIHFEDMMYANCCPDELELEMTVEDNLITIYEIEYTSEGCRCMCSFPITATLGPFEDGTYTVEVYDNYGNLLGVVEVTIGGSTGPGITYQIEDCNQEASVSFTAEPPDKTRFTVTVEGLYIHFEDMMVANCCPDELGLEMVVEDNLITIYESEYTPGGCYCICDYPVTATLGPFEPGTYILEVYEEWSGFIGSTTVVIDPL